MSKAEKMATEIFEHHEKWLRDADESLKYAESSRLPASHVDYWRGWKDCLKAVPVFVADIIQDVLDEHEEAHD